MRSKQQVGLSLQRWCGDLCKPVLGYLLRYPRWGFYIARAKVLLSISEAKHRALAEVLGENQAQRRTPKPHARLARIRLALGLKRSI